jgi:general secretion pathway protein J
MRKDRPRIRHRVAGFTLIEALAAIVLMGMILTALATVTAQWLPNWNRGFARVQRAELLEIALERVVADLAAAEFVSPNRKSTRPLFEGTELAVTFVRLALGPNARPGLEIVRIAETADRQGPALVRARMPFVPAATSAEQSRFTDPVVLLRAPYKVSFSYAGQDRVWKSTWVDARELPAAVRLAIRDAATERTLAVSTAAVIHTQLPAACASSKEGRRCGRSAQSDAESTTSDTDTSDSDSKPRRSQ